MTKVSSTRLKICGITTLADARYCAGAGVHYLGFIQYSPSPRYIESDKAREIINWLYGPETVGVFVNETPENINAAASSAGFSMVQIHGHQSPDFFREIEKPVIKAVSIHPETTSDTLKNELDRFADHVDYFLLDTAKAGMWGGTGSVFDWDLAQDLVRAYPLFIAGGIDPSNIREVVEKLHPFAVDLSSGVEETPGVKDFDKLATLFDAMESIQ